MEPWVYYNRDGERATDEWKKSGNSWYYLDSNGEMAIDQLIEDDEPDQNWYYFQANGKALTNGDNDNVSLKTINGKKYAFNEYGEMLYGLQALKLNPDDPTIIEGNYMIDDEDEWDAFVAHSNYSGDDGDFDFNGSLLYYFHPQGRLPILCRFRQYLPVKHRGRKYGNSCVL